MNMAIADADLLLHNAHEDLRLAVTAMDEGRTDDVERLVQSAVARARRSKRYGATDAQYAEFMHTLDALEEAELKPRDGETEYGLTLTHTVQCEKCATAAHSALGNLERLGIRRTRVTLDGIHTATASTT